MTESALYIAPGERAPRMPEKTSVIAAPGPKTENGDLLVLSLTTSDATGSVDIRGRVMTENGEINEFGRTMTFSGTGTQTEVVAPLAAGWIVGFDVSRASGTITDGEVVASVHICRNAGSLQQKLMCLASGEVTSIRSLGLGAFLIGASQTSPATAALTVTTVANPAAATDWSTTIPAGEQWEIISIAALLTIGALAGNRTISIKADDGTTTLAQAVSSATYAANAIVRMSAGAVGESSSRSVTTFSVAVLALPPLVLGPGSRILTECNNLQGADQWSAIRVAAMVTAV